MKVKQIAAAGMIFCLVCAVASVWLGRFTGENVAFILKYRQSLPKIEALKASVSRIPSGVNVESLKAETEKAKYDATKLSVDISGEMSRFGMVVMDVSVKQVSGNEVSVSIKGMVPADRLYDFVLGVSSIDKLFSSGSLETLREIRLSIEDTPSTKSYSLSAGTMPLIETDTSLPETCLTDTSMTTMPKRDISPEISTDSLVASYFAFSVSAFRLSTFTPEGMRDTDAFKASILGRDCLYLSMKATFSPVKRP